MPRLVQYVSEGRMRADYAHWFAAWIHDDRLPTQSERDGMNWMEWPFENAQGCLACAWAHWYGLAYDDPCPSLGQEEDWTRVLPDCGYANDYQLWCDGIAPFNPDEPWLYNSRAQQRRAIGARATRDPDSGCLACHAYAGVSGWFDPCSHHDSTTLYRRCGYYTWYRREGNPDLRREREERAARRRNPDYPNEYRSREGRGSCRLRRDAGRCPPGCPCRNPRPRPENTVGMPDDAVRPSLNPLFVGWSDLPNGTTQEFYVAWDEEPEEEPEW